MLALLCKIALEPDTCVRRTEEIFRAHGPHSLVIAKFVPGLSTMAPPLAGVVGLGPLPFLLYDALGTALWVGSGLGIGYAFGAGAPEIAAQATQLTPVVGLVLTGLMGLYVTAKAWWRRAALQRAPRITAADALEIAARQGHPDEAVRHLRAATVKEDALRYYEPPLWHYPVRHSLGAVLLQAGRAAEAEQVYRQDLKQHPENGWALYGLKESLLAQGKRKEASAVQRRFQKAWARADIQLRASRL